MASLTQRLQCATTILEICSTKTKSLIWPQIISCPQLYSLKLVWKTSLETKLSNLKISMTKMLFCAKRYRTLIRKWNNTLKLFLPAVTISSRWVSTKACDTKVQIIFLVTKAKKTCQYKTRKMQNMIILSSWKKQSRDSVKCRPSLTNGKK